VNDEPTNVEAVDLSPTRAELIAHVRARGRQIRARRRLGIAGLATLAVVAIAAPAIAIGTRSTSHTALFATHAHGFEIAAIRASETQSASRGGTKGCPTGTLPSPNRLDCLKLSRAYAGRSSIVSVGVQPRGHTWTVVIDLDSGIANDLARFQLRHGWAVVVDGAVIAILKPPPVGRNGWQTSFIVAQNLSRGDAIALGTRIWGRVPRIVSARPATSSHIELPGNTFAVGPDIHGTLVITNDTGKAVTLEHGRECHGKWAATLTNASFPARVTFTQECSSQRTVIAPGVTRFPFDIITSYPACGGTGSPGHPAAPACLPNNAGPPPLPAGTYHAVVVDDLQNGEFPPRHR
jgi:hypothetical protein